MGGIGGGGDIGNERQTPIRVCVGDRGDYVCEFPLFFPLDKFSFGVLLLLRVFLFFFFPIGI